MNLPEHPQCLYNNDTSLGENVADLVEKSLKVPFAERYNGLLYRFEAETVIIPPNTSQCQVDQSKHNCRVAIQSIIVKCTISALSFELSEPPTPIVREEYRFSNLEVNITASYEISPPNYILLVQPSPEAKGNAADLNFEKMRACLRGTNGTEHKEYANVLLGLFVERRSTSACQITSINADYYI